MLKNIPIKLKSSRPWTADFRDPSTLPNLQASVVKKYFLMGSCLFILLAAMWAIYSDASVRNQIRDLKDLENFLKQNKKLHQMSLQKNQEFVTKKALIEAMSVVQSFPLNPFQVLMEEKQQKPKEIKYTFISIENSKNTFVFEDQTKTQNNRQANIPYIPTPTSSSAATETKDAFSIRLEGLIKGSDTEALAIFDKYKKDILQWTTVKPFLTKLSLKADPIRLEGYNKQMKFNTTFKNE